MQRSSSTTTTTCNHVLQEGKRMIHVSFPVVFGVESFDGFDEKRFRVIISHAHHKVVWSASVISCFLPSLRRRKEDREGNGNAGASLSSVYLTHLTVGRGRRWLLSFYNIIIGLMMMYRIHLSFYKNSSKKVKYIIFYYEFYNEFSI